MGFFSKVWKGLKKTVKKIGKGIKSAFKKFGKFMGKIGILGQVAMFFIMPYVGAALGGMFTGAAGALATNTVGGALGAVGQAAGKVMQFVGNTVGKAGTVFSNITKGVTDTLGNFAKTASNKMFGTTFDAASNFFTGGDSAFSRSFGADSKFQNLTKDFSKVTSAIEETVAESADDSRAYGQTEFRNDPIYDQAIKEGGTEMTASLGQPSSDLAFSESLTVDTVPFDPMSQENFARGMIDDTISPTGSDGFQTLVGNVNPDAVYQPSLMERLQTGIKEAPANIYKKAGEIADDPLGYAFKGTEKSIQQQMNLRVGQELGISAKPEYNVQNVSNVAYVPSFESFGGSQQQYGAPEIMNARAFEQQVTNNPSPYGYTAFQYNNYMAQFGQTA